MLGPRIFAGKAFDGRVFDGRSLQGQAAASVGGSGSSASGRALAAISAERPRPVAAVVRRDADDELALLLCLLG